MKSAPVRLAQPGDAAQVAELLAELGYPGNRTAEVRRRLAMWDRETAGLVLVAEHQGQVVGVIAVTAIPYLEREGRWGRIVALVVSSACRGQGIGRRLVDAAEKAAGELDCVCWLANLAERVTRPGGPYGTPTARRPQGSLTLAAELRRHGGHQPAQPHRISSLLPEPRLRRLV